MTATITPAKPDGFDTWVGHEGKTSCAHCSRSILALDALTVTKHTNRGDMKEDFCGEACANEFYLERLREAGL